MHSIPVINKTTEAKSLNNGGPSIQFVNIAMRIIYKFRQDVCVLLGNQALCLGNLASLSVSHPYALETLTVEVKDEETIKTDDGWLNPEVLTSLQDRDPSTKSPADFYQIERYSNAQLTKVSGVRRRAGSMFGVGLYPNQNSHYPISLGDLLDHHSYNDLVSYNVSRPTLPKFWIEDSNGSTLMTSPTEDKAVRLSPIELPVFLQETPQNLDFEQFMIRKYHSARVYVSHDSYLSCKPSDEPVKVSDHVENMNWGSVPVAGGGIYHLDVKAKSIVQTHANGW
jgi:hypothetical protein